MNSVLERIPYYAEVKVKLKYWFAPEKPDVMRLRNTLIGVMVAITIAEVAVYKMIQQNIRKGDLPNYTADTLIISTSILEAVLGPFVTWYGFRMRSSTLFNWLLLWTVSSLMWYALPQVTIIDAAESCEETYTFSGLTAEALVRLTILSLSCIVFSLTRTAVIAHGIAYIDQENPEKISLHYGLLIVARVLPLFLADRFATSGVDNNTGSHIGGLMFECFINLIQIPMAMPRNNVTKTVENTDDNTVATEAIETQEEIHNADENTENIEREDLKEAAQSAEVLEIIENEETKERLEEEIDSDNNETQEIDRGFLSSMKRLLSNKLALYQMVSMGLLAAALWGFGFHSEEIIKVKYYIDPRRSFVECFHYAFVVICVLYASTFYYPITLAKEIIKMANNIAVKMSGVVLVAYYVIISVGDCRKGLVAGVNPDSYSIVACGEKHCTPRWREFSPVCVPDSMLTYLSPREAGCMGVYDFDGVGFHIKCACSLTSIANIATDGACSSAVCTPGYYFYLTLFLLIVIATTLSLQAQGVLVLRAVDQRDKSLALGLAGSIVTLFTSVLAHLIYKAVLDNTCLWFEEGRCHLQTDKFPLIVGWISIALTVLSIAFTILAWKSRDTSDEPQTETTEETTEASEKKIN